MLTGMFPFLHHDAYLLNDTGATHFYVSVRNVDTCCIPVDALSTSLHVS